MINLAAQIIAQYNINPAIKGVMQAAFNTADEQSLLRWYQQDPDTMQAKITKELTSKLSQDPELVAQFTVLLATDTPQTWQIQGQHVGVVTMPQANFQGAQNVNITGLQLPSPQPSPKGRGSRYPSPPRKGAEAKAKITAQLASMSDDEIIIFCYDYARHLYAQLPHNRHTLRRELLAYLEYQ